MVARKLAVKLVELAIEHPDVEVVGVRYGVRPLLPKDNLSVIEATYESEFLEEEDAVYLAKEAFLDEYGEDADVSDFSEKIVVWLY